MTATKLTTQKLHKIIQDKIKVKSSKYSPSQRIDRSTYDVCTRVHGILLVMACENGMIQKIEEACLSAGLKVDSSKILKGLIAIKR